jgi:trk system potassium uptake protein TrkA
MVAKELADKSSWPNVLDFLPIDPEYSVVEITVPESLEGKTLAEADLRSTVGVFVLGLRDVMQGRFQMFPEGRTKLIQDQILLVIGREEELARLREMN